APPQCLRKRFGLLLDRCQRDVRDLLDPAEVEIEMAGQLLRLRTGGVTEQPLPQSALLDCGGFGDVDAERMRRRTRPRFARIDEAEPAGTGEEALDQQRRGVAALDLGC